jgi:hypothetical protein
MKGKKLIWVEVILDDIIQHCEATGLAKTAQQLRVAKTAYADDIIHKAKKDALVKRSSFRVVHFRK